MFDIENCFAWQGSMWKCYCSWFIITHRFIISLSMQKYLVIVLLSLGTVTDYQAKLYEWISSQQWLTHRFDPNLSHKQVITFWQWSNFAIGKCKIWHWLVQRTALWWKTVQHDSWFPWILEPMFPCWRHNSAHFAGSEVYHQIKKAHCCSCRPLKRVFKPSVVSMDLTFGLEFWSPGVRGHVKLLSSNVWMLLDVMSSPSVCCRDNNRRAWYVQTYHFWGTNLAQSMCFLKAGWVPMYWLTLTTVGQYQGSERCQLRVHATTPNIVKWTWILVCHAGSSYYMYR